MNTHNETATVHAWKELEVALGVSKRAIYLWRQDPAWRFELPVNVAAVAKWRAKHRGAAPPKQTAARGGKTTHARRAKCQPKPKLKVAAPQPVEGPEHAGATGEQADLPLNGEPTTHNEADLRLKIRREKHLALQTEILAGKYTETETVRGMLMELVDLFTTELEQSVQTLPAQCAGLDEATIATHIDRFVQGVRDRLEAKMRAGVK